MTNWGKGCPCGASCEALQARIASNCSGSRRVGGTVTEGNGQLVIIGDRSLGPVRVELGGMKPGNWPWPTKIAIAIFPLLGAFLMICAVIFIIRMLSPDRHLEYVETMTSVIAWGLGGLFLLAGIVFICGGFLLLSFMLTMKVTIHDNGLVIVRRWFRPLQVSWSEVSGFAVPEPGGSSNACSLLLRNGRKQIIERLSLPSTRDHTGQIIPHPDVRIVIDHFLGWQRANGVR